MLRVIKQLSISKRLQIISFVSISFICILIVLIFYTKQKEEQVTDTVRVYHWMELNVWMKIKAYNCVRGDFLTIVFADPATQSENIKEALEYFNERQEDLVSYKEDMTYWGEISPEIQAHYDSLDDAINAYVSYCKDKIQIITQPSTNDTVNLAEVKRTALQESNELYRNIRSHAIDILEAIGINVDQTETKIETDIKQMMLLFYILSGLLVVIIFFVIRVIGRSMLRPIHETRASLELLSKGGLPVIKEYQGKDELSTMLQSLRGFSAHMTSLLSFVSNVARKNFNEEAKMFEGKGLIAEALISMRDNLAQHAMDESQRSWTVQGQADLANLIRQQANFDTICDQALAYIVKYMRASHGALYIMEMNNDREHLRLASVYAYARKKYISGTVQPGEGLIGTVYLERQMTILRDVPEDYIKITSGLGEALPQCLVICPLMLNERVYGVLEIASFKAFEQHDTDLIQKFGEQLASAIATGQINQRTEELLRESQLNTETLRVREEEMKRYVEQLRTAHNQTEFELAESKTREHQLQSILQTLGQNLIVVDSNFKVISLNTHNNNAMRRLFSKPLSVGGNILSLSDNSIRESIQNILSTTIHFGEMRKLTVDGISITSKPFHNKQGGATLCLIVVDEESKLIEI